MFSKTGIPLFEEMSWKDVERLLKQTDVCIVPIGAIEQHGPHLPLGTDTYIAQEIACGRAPC
jgi:creatinine amidohydrolase